MKIPKPILKQASYLVSRFGNQLRYRGKLDGSQLWQFCFPDDMVVGLPVLYQYKNGKVTQMDGERAAELLASRLDED